MRGTTLDFLRLVAEKPELAREFAEFAAKHDFELSDEIGDAVRDDAAAHAHLHDVATIAAKRHPTDRCPSE